MNWVRIGPDNGLPPARRQTITWTQDWRTHRNELKENSNQNTKVSIYENALENVVCEMAAILSRGSD